MAWLLNLAYLALLFAAAPLLLWRAWRQGKYRAGWGEKFFGRVPRRDGDRPCLWLHAVSVGEVNLLAPLIARWEKLHPEWDCVISTTTRAGYELAHKRYAPRQVFYCPLDFSWAVRRALGRVRPTLLVLAELELWPNLVAEAHRRGMKVAVVNGRLSERSCRGYRRIGWLVRRTLSQIDLLAVQNQDYAARFLSLGAAPDAVRVTGSVKFDGACTDRGNSATRRLAALAGIQPDDFVFLAGSTQAPEEELALNAFLRHAGQQPHLRLILVPRHPERFDEVAALLDRRQVCWQRRSLLDKEPRDATARILLVDAVGELGAWWGTARVAFVGGSMGSRGGQNMIEPAAYGAAVSFGPHTANFRDVVAQLLAVQGAVVASSGSELEAFLARCLADRSFAEELGQRARSLVLSQGGAADRTISLLSELAGQPRHRRLAA